MCIHEKSSSRPSLGGRPQNNLYPPPAAALGPASLCGGLLRLGSIDNPTETSGSSNLPIALRTAPAHPPKSGVQGAVVGSCVDGPRFARVLWRVARSLAVMCPAFQCGLIGTAGPDGFRESRPYQIVGVKAREPTQASLDPSGRPTSPSRFLALASSRRRRCATPHAAAATRR